LRGDLTIESPIHRVFEAWAEHTPAAVALVFGAQQVTYGELNRRANRLAHHLVGLGAGPGVLVGVGIDRSVDRVVAMLAILKAGAAYVPLDASYPAERLAYMIADTRLPVLLASRARAPIFAEHGARVVILESAAEQIERCAGGDLAREGGGDDLAYVMYTSGSTGRPKGVMVVHRGVVRLVTRTRYVDFGPDHVFWHAAPSSFDASTFEIWGALLNGGRLAIAPPQALTLEELGREIRLHRVTTLWLTAGLFNAMVDERLGDLAGVRRLLAGGEALSVPHVRRFLDEARSCELINGYGPTESTTFACCHTIEPLDPRATSVPIGRPITNTYVHLLDPEMRPVPPGALGELYIGGAGLARGYLNLPELTAERFVCDPFAPDTPGARLYKTGDLARRLPDGALEFVGRADDQVKIHGFRIELGEIAATLAGVPGVRESVVTTREDVPGSKRLIAYVVPEGGASFSDAAVRGHLAGKLPDYMLPAVVLLERLPRTPNGKVDRRALPAPEQSRHQPARAPQTPAEIKLTAIWENVLGLRSVSASDDFFELSGDSMLAIRIFAQIEQGFGVKLPLAALFRAPTIGQLARILERQGPEAQWSSITAIQPRGTRPPVFWGHGLGGGGGGGLLRYRKIAERLGSDQPSFGIEAPRVPFSDLVPMAAHYVQIMRTVQPEGPYHLAGFSFGGNVVFEMARQLREMGQEVGLLALIETELPHPSMDPVPPWEALRLVAVSVPGWLDTLRSRPLRAQLARLRSRVRAAAGRASASLAARPPARGSPEERRLSDEIDLTHYPADYLAFAETHWSAYLSYVARPYPGHITLIRTRAQRLFELDPTLGWGRLARGGVTIRTVRATHDDILGEPHVDLVACYLKESLDEALAPPTGAQRRAPR
jgi:amino acid adenylation domain-containing protein